MHVLSTISFLGVFSLRRPSLHLVYFPFDLFNQQFQTASAALEVVSGLGSNVGTVESYAERKDGVQRTKRTNEINSAHRLFVTDNTFSSSSSLSRFISGRRSSPVGYVAGSMCTYSAL